MMVFATGGICTLSERVQGRIRMITFFQRNLLKLFGIALVLLACLYVFLPAQEAFVYYGLYPSFIPTSMVQSTVPLSDMASLVRSLQWAAANMKPGMALITNATIYGWARDYFPFQDRIVDYGYGISTRGIEMALSAGYSSAIMIWWAYGEGWYGQASIPNTFVPVHRDGAMEVYLNLQMS